MFSHCLLCKQGVAGSSPATSTNRSAAVPVPRQISHGILEYSSTVLFVKLICEDLLGIVNALGGEEFVHTRIGFL